MLEAAAAKRAASIAEVAKENSKPWPNRFLAFFTGRKLSVIDEERTPRDEMRPSGGVPQKLRPDMIRRMDDTPKLVNPSGWLSEGHASSGNSHPQPETLADNPSNEPSSSSIARSNLNRRRTISIDLGATPYVQASSSYRMPMFIFKQDTTKTIVRSRPPIQAIFSECVLIFLFYSCCLCLALAKMYRSETMADTPSTSGSPKRFHRTQTIEFAPTPKPRGKFGHSKMLDNGPLQEEPDEILSPEHSRVSTCSSPLPMS